MINEELKLIYIHPPKTGGWSICTLFNGDLDEKRRVMPKHHSIHYYKNLGIDLNKYFIFSTTRNPWERMVSAYVFLMDVFKRDKENIEKRIYDITTIEEFSKMTFENYVDITFNHSLNEKTSINLTSDNSCWFFIEPILDWITYENKICVDYICNQSNLEEDLKIVKKLLNYSVDTPNINKTSHNDYREFYNLNLKKKLNKYF